MLTSGIRKRLDIPHEPGEWVELRLLSWEQLNAAREARVSRAMRMVRELGDSLNNVPKPAAGETDHVPEESFDRGVLLRAAVTGWSYQVPLSNDAIGDLDERTASWLAGEIVAMNVIDADQGERSAAVSHFPTC